MSIRSRFLTGRISLAPALRIKGIGQNRNIRVSFPLSVEEGQGVATYNGSAAIYQIARLLRLGKGSTVLLPAYCCGSEQEALVSLGCDIRYYKIRDNLQLELSDILNQLDSPVHLVYVTHYFGFPQEEIEELCRICSERNLPVLEDCALSLYSMIGDRPVGSFGDYAVFSERKSLALTEGGYLVSNRKQLPNSAIELKKPPLIPRLDRLLNTFITSLNEFESDKPASFGNRLSVFTILPISICVKTLRVLGQRYFSTWLPPDAEGESAANMYDFGMSRLALSLFQNTDPDWVVKKRRKHYRIWLEAIDSIPGCTALFPHLPEGCSPLYMPVLCTKRDQAIDYLRERNIEVSPWWYDERKDIDWGRHSNLLPIKRNMLVLPVHHEIDTNDLCDRLSVSRQSI